jgi:hypothetical protein
MFRWMVNRKIVLNRGKGKSVLPFRDGNKTKVINTCHHVSLPMHLPAGRAGLNSPVIASSLRLSLCQSAAS